MAHLDFHYPLQWPEHITATPRLKQSEESGFSSYMTVEEVLAFLKEEIEGLNPPKALLSTDIDQISAARGKIQRLRRSGACLELKLGSTRYFLTCDRWAGLEHNIYALYLTLRHMRNMERWGVAPLHMLLSPFAAGYQTVAASAPSSHEEWMHVLGLGSTATLDDATAVYHRRARKISHDDKALIALNHAMSLARKALS